MNIFNKIKSIGRQLKEIAHFANAAKNSAWYPIDENKIATLLYTGQIMVVDRRDLSVAPHIILRGEWEFEYGQFFRSIVRPGDVVFDVGANVGYFGIIAGTENGYGEVHFFEANPSLCECIEKSIWLNGLSRRGWVVNSLVADEDGKVVEFHMLEDLWGSSGVGGVNKDAFTVDCLESDTVQMNAITLDAYCDSIGKYKCDIVKMDVEGCEEQVLNGMVKVLSENPDMRVFAEHTFGRYSSDYWVFLNKWFREIYVIDCDYGRTLVYDEAGAIEAAENDDFCMLYMVR